MAEQGRLEAKRQTIRTVPILLYLDSLQLEAVKAAEMMSDLQAALAAAAVLGAAVKELAVREHLGRQCKVLLVVAVLLIMRVAVAVAQGKLDQPESLQPAGMVAMALHRLLVVILSSTEAVVPAVDMEVAPLEALEAPEEVEVLSLIKMAAMAQTNAAAAALGLPWLQRMAHTPEATAVLAL